MKQNRPFFEIEFIPDDSDDHFGVAIVPEFFEPIGDAFEALPPAIRVKYEVMS